jgi:hypothetical protein
MTKPVPPAKAGPVQLALQDLQLMAKDDHLHFPAQVDAGASGEPKQTA